MNSIYPITRSLPLPSNTFDGILWLLLLLGPLLFLQRALHREIQTVFLLITRRPEIAVAMFSMLFFPGVLLHESSHYLMAKILGVRTGRVSLIPESIEGNRLRLGFVETSTTDILRDALIGTAPLLAGGLFVAYAGIVHLDLLSVWDGLASGNIEAAQESSGCLVCGSRFLAVVLSDSYCQQHNVPIAVGSKSLASGGFNCDHHCWVGTVVWGRSVDVRKSTAGAQ